MRNGKWGALTLIPLDITGSLKDSDSAPVGTVAAAGMAASGKQVPSHSNGILVLEFALILLWNAWHWLLPVGELLHPPVGGASSQPQGRAELQMLRPRGCILAERCFSGH